MPSFEEIAKMTVFYQVAGTEHVTVRKDIVFQEADGNKYHLDLYAPSENPDKKLPAVILIHGEAALSRIKEIGQYTSMASIIAASGMIAVPFDRRMVMTGATIAEVEQNIDQLIQFIRVHALEYHIDPNRLAVWSFSAGVPFGLKIALDPHREYLKCSVAYYGPADVSVLSKILPITLPDDNPAILPQQGNFDSSKGSAIPLLIARAGLDSPLINDDIAKFINLALEKNLPITIANHPTGHHAFDILDDEARTREIIAMTLSYLKDHLL